MRKSRISREKQHRLIEHFVAGTMARCSANLIGVNFKTAAYYFRRLREIIVLETENESLLSGEFEHVGECQRYSDDCRTGQKLPDFHYLQGITRSWIPPVSASLLILQV